MNKLNSKLKSGIDLNEKIVIYIENDCFEKVRVKELRKHFGCVNYSQLIKKCIEFLAYGNVNYDKELLSQIKYNENITSFIYDVRKQAKDLDNENFDEKYYTVKIEFWVLVFCLNSLDIKDEITIKHFVSKLFDKNLQIYYKLFGRKRF